MTRGRERSASPPPMRKGGRSALDMADVTPASIAALTHGGGGRRREGGVSFAGGSPGDARPSGAAPSSVSFATASVSFAAPRGAAAGGLDGEAAPDPPDEVSRGRSRIASRGNAHRGKSIARAYSPTSEATTDVGTDFGEELPIEEELMNTANELARPGAGILAADETVAVLGKRFAAVGLDNTVDTRRAYREMLFSAPDLEQYASGVVLYAETVHQATESGVNFVEMLAARGILVGVKLDRGLHPFGDGEMITEGIDGLDARAAAAYTAGIRFAKWRALFIISFDKGTPSALAVEENANALAKFAVACQQRRLVPLVEPEIYIAGTHGLGDAASVAEEVLSVVYRAMARHGVLLEGTLLQVQMVLPGLEHPTFRTTPSEAIAVATLRTLRRVVPAAVPGVVFLSGGQSEVEATVNLNAINRAAEAETHNSGTASAPWPLSFAFGRVLQASAMKLWARDMDDAGGEAKAMVASLLRVNSDASRGRFRGPKYHPSNCAKGNVEAHAEDRARCTVHELTPRSSSSSRVPSPARQAARQMLSAVGQYPS